MPIHPSKAKATLMAASAMMVLIVLGFMLALVLRGEDAALRNASERVERVLDTAEAEVNRNLVSVDMMLAEIADWARDADRARFAPGAGAAQQAALQRLIRSTLNQNLMLRDVAIIDSSAEVLISARPSTGRLGLPLPPDFLADVMTQPFPVLRISAPVLKPLDSERVLFVARSVPLPQGRRALVVAELQLPLLSALMDPGNGSPGMQITLEKDTGQLLASHPQNEPLLGQVLRPGLMAQTATGRASLRPGRVQPGPVLLAYRPTLYAGLLLSVEQPRGDALAAWQRERLLIVGMGGALSALVLLAALLTWRYIVHLSRSRADTAQANERLQVSNRELGASLSLIEATLEATADAVMVEHPHGVVQRHNALLVHLLALTPELVESAELQRIGTAVAAQLQDARRFLEVLHSPQSATTAEVRVELVFQDGRVLQCHVLPQRLDGQVVGRVWSFQDITAYKRAEQALLAQQVQLNDALDHLTATLDAIPDLLFEVDASGRFVGYPSGPVGLLAMPPERFLGRTLAEVLPGPAALQIRLALQEASEHKTSVGRQVELKLTQWHKWFELSVSCKRTGPDELQRFIVLSRDITDRKLAQQAVVTSEARFRHVLQNVSSVAVQGHLLNGTIQYWNNACEQLYGYSAEEAIGANMIDLIIPQSMQSAMRQRLEEVARTGQPGTPGEVTLRRKDGTSVSVFSSHAVVQTPGQATELFCIDVDLTERKRAEAQLQLSASVFTHAREAIMITDPQGNIVEVNDAFSRITGYSRSEAVGQNPRILKSGRQPPEHYALMWHTLQRDGFWSGEVWNRRKNGEVYAEMQTISSVRDADHRVQQYVALFTDITPMKEHQRQLEHMAHYDALTGLPNRVLLADRLEQAMRTCVRRRKELAVVYLDLDGFKGINDLHGHNIGDELLIALSRRLQLALREGDTLARIGGDEFVAVLVELDGTADCEPVLARLLQAAADAVTIDGTALQVSASLGVTMYPLDGVDADQLMRHADQAMYQAKQAGKNRFHLFDVQRDAQAKSQHESLQRMRLALSEGEFVLYYQPKVHMKTSRVVGAEALIRWQHPERGLLAPAQFIPLIEGHPFSIELGEWVMAQALAQAAQWHHSGQPLPVSVNVGAHQLQHPGFLAGLAALLRRHPDLPPGTLELEVLETSVLDDLSQIATLMRECRALGVEFAIDDFGTGYSSLTYLKLLPAQLLKIDQSFVRNMLDNPDDLAIVGSVIGLSTAFRRKVIAEGVETIAHGELLLKLGCDLAQGYGVARPMPAADLAPWAAQWRADAAWTAWQGRPLRREDMALVFAQVEHRHWLRELEAYLDQRQDTHPEMDALQCHLGRWLDGEGKAQWGGRAEYAQVCALHDRIHAIGHQMVTLQRQGRSDDAVRQLNDMHDTAVRMIECMRQLVLV